MCWLTPEFVLIKTTGLKHKAAIYIIWGWLSVLAVTSLLAPVLSTDKPWVVKKEGRWLFPAFNTHHAQKILPQGSMSSEWKLQKFEKAFWPPCTYQPGNTDWYNISVSPLDKQQFVTQESEIVSMPAKFRHWLGTNHKGEDVMAAVIYGCRHSLAVGLFSMLLAGLIGIVLGLVAGYYQNYRLQVSWGATIGFFIGLIPALFYGVVRPSQVMHDDSTTGMDTWIISVSFNVLIFISLLAGCILTGHWVSKKIPWFSRRVSIPADSIITRITEWMNSVPTLLLILILAGLFNKSSTGLIVILGLLQWTGIARIVRSETLSLRQTGWIESAISLGIPEFRLFSQHLFPHILPSFLVVFILGITGSIMAESSLSFLGAGIPDNWISWGTLSGDGKRHLDNWWLLAIPGMLIFLTLLCLSALAEQYRRK